ncbi:hypothetical protein QA942_19970 [Streptomyces sp. B21-106]|jgi:hypothetical protein|uniref:hypothetical protein n=1 Tax=Streptomyces sp. B21-106 TaxID=3039418 RepID=UPI002FF185C5
MGQQISTDDALPIYRQTCGELFDSNLLLRAKVAGLERDLAAAQEENSRLKQAAGEPGPVSGGPDLAAVPPFPAADER